jgi:hypothetical protein
MRPTLLGIALILSLVSCLYAQKAPGYMGRRLFVRPEIGYNPALSAPTASNRGNNTYGEQGNRLGFNTKYGLQVGYAVSRSAVLSLDGSYLATGLILEASTPSILFPNNADEHYLFYKLSGTEIGLAWNVFNVNNGGIAPMGNYATLRARMVFLKGEVLDKRTTYYRNYSSAGHLPLGINPSYGHLALGVELGRQMMIGNRVVFSISVEGNLSPFKYLSILLGNYSEGTNQDDFNYEAWRRMTTHSLVMFKTGLGYLF